MHRIFLISAIAISVAMSLLTGCADYSTSDLSYQTSPDPVYAPAPAYQPVVEVGPIEPDLPEIVVDDPYQPVYRPSYRPWFRYSGYAGAQDRTEVRVHRGEHREDHTGLHTHRPAGHR